MARAGRHLIRKLGISLATLIVVVGGAELVCRAAGYAPRTDVIRWMAHPDLQALPMPSQRVWSGQDDPDSGRERICTTINRYSQRGLDYPLGKEPGELRVAIVGDSLTMGKGLDDADCFPQLLRDLYAAQPPAGGAPRVINAGINGWTSWHYMRWAETQLEVFQPDVLVIGLYLGNDMVPAFNAPLAIPVPMENALRGSALYRFLVETYRAHLWKRIEATRRGKTVEELDADLEAYMGKREQDLTEEDQRVLWERNSLANIERARDACRVHGVPLVCLMIPSYPMVLQPEPPAVYGFVRERLEQLEIPVVECFEPIRAAGDGAWQEHDVGHLSALGCGIVAGILRDELARLGLVR